MSVPYEPSKWRIVYGSAEGTEGFALSELCGRISQELCQNIACVSAANFVRECENQSIVLMGTLKNNPLLAPYSEGLSSEPESYLIRTVNEGDCRQVLVIAGADPSGVLYGVCDFISKYADMLDHGHNYRGVRYKPFSDALPEINDASTPDIKKRGIWTWGRCIYDYRGFFDNMARCKMNTAVIWNDIAPLNGAEVVRYAHMRGVKILWGFSWGWSTEKAIDLSSEEDLNEWRDRIVSDYEKIWAPLGGDGIYFQTATECDEKLINGKPLAWWAVNWVNGIAAAMYEKYPDLDIEFGLHATSVRDTTEYLSQIDPKMAITWEDGGSFPFAYHAWDIEDYDETLELTDKMLSLRGENEKAGFVFKGIKTLFWPEFMPARDGFILGEAPECVIEKKFKEARGDIRTEQAWWLSNLGYLTNVCRKLVESGKVSGSVTVLCEDGCFERARWIPCILFAEALWDTSLSDGELIRRAALCRDAVFA